MMGAMDATRVLVVDDEPMVREVLARYLEREGYAVDVAEDGEQALATYAATTPDLVLLDLMLPRIDGLEVFRRIRDGARDDPRPAVIMLTAKRDETDRIVGLELGADDYVTKPFSPREVVARVRAELLEEVWDFAWSGDTGTVTVHVRRLREKIEHDPSRPRHLLTVWGVGYRFEP